VAFSFRDGWLRRKVRHEAEVGQVSGILLMRGDAHALTEVPDASDLVGLPAQPRRIGFLGADTQSGVESRLGRFRAGLRDLGYVEGDNVFIDFRWAEGNYARLTDFAAELVRLKVDLLVTYGTPGTPAAKKATTAVPQGTFSKMLKIAPDAIALTDDAVFIANARTISDRADNRLPSVGFVNFAQVGGLIGYGVDFPDLWYRAAYSEDLPIEQAVKFDSSSISKLPRRSALRYRPCCLRAPTR
jgi:ABC transporter substrate binding protein